MSTMEAVTSYRISGREKRPDAAAIGNGIVFACLLASVVYLIIQIMIHGRTGENDYVLSLVQCCLGMVVLPLPTLLCKKFALELPNAMKLMYAGFLFCAIFLGEVFNFYYLIPNWDDVLHFTSGILCGFLGCMILGMLNRKQKADLNFPPIFVALFAIIFAISVGAVWEIYEFVADGLLGMNMQKAMLLSGEMLVGRAAVADTMIDIIVDTCGALMASLVAYRSLKHRKGWIYSYMKNEDTLQPAEDTSAKAA